MSDFWPDDRGRDARGPVPRYEEVDWRCCQGMRFRSLGFFSDLRVCFLPNDGERNIIGHLAYSDEIVLRAGPW